MAEDIKSGNAAFTEVIEVALNAGPGSEFDKGLKAMMQGYKQFLSELRAEADKNGIDPKSIVGGADGLGTIENVMKSLQKGINDLNKNIRDAFSLTGEEAKEMAEEVEQAVDQIKQKTKEVQQSVGTGTTDINAKRTPEEKLGITQMKAQELDAKRTASQQAEAAITQDMLAEGELRQNKQLALLQDGLHKKEAATLKSWEKEYNLEEKDYQNTVKLRQKEEADAAAARAKELADLRAHIEKKYEIRSKWEAEANAQSNRAAWQAEEEKRKRQNTALKQDIMSRYPQAGPEKAMNTRPLEEQLRLFREIRANGPAAYQALDDSHKKWFTEFIDREHKVDTQLKVMGKTLEGQSTFWTRFAGGITKDWGTMFATVARFAIGFKLVFAAIGLVEGAFRGLFNSFKTGFDYLTKREEQAAEIQEVLADHVSFVGKNVDIVGQKFKENFQLAGDAAEYVQKRLEDVADRTHFTAEATQAVYQAIMGAGEGANYVKTLEESVKLTELFSAALKAAGEKTTNIRKLQTEVTNLLNGQVTEKTKILKMLNLTPAAWEEIRKKAQSNRDLVAQLEERMLGYYEKQKGVENRHKEMDLIIARTKERLSAMLAKPLWDMWLQVLRGAYHYFQQYGPQIKAFVVGFGTLVARVFQFVGGIIKALYHLPGIKMLIFSIIGAVVILIEFVNIFLDSLTRGLNIIGETLKRVFSTAMIKNPKETMKGIAEYARTQGEAFQKNFDAARNRVKGFFGDKVPSDEAGNQNIDPSDKPNNPPGKGSGNPLEDLKNRMRAEIDEIKAQAEQARRDIEYQVRSHAITQAEASRLLIQSYQAEETAIIGVRDKYNELAQGMKGVKAAKVKDFIADNLHDTTKEHQKYANTIQDIELDLYKFRTELAQKTYEAITEAQEKYMDAYMTRLKVQREMGKITAEELAAAEHAATVSKLRGDIGKLESKRYRVSPEERDDIDRQIAMLRFQLDQENQLYKDAKAKARAEDLENEREHQATMTEMAIEGELQQLKNQEQLETSETRLIAIKRRQLQLEIALAKARLESAKAAEEEARQRGVTGDTLNKLIQNTTKEQNNVASAQGALNTFDTEEGSFYEIFQATGIEEAFGTTTSALESLANAAEWSARSVTNIISAFQQGKAGGGGILGGIGGMLGGLFGKDGKGGVIGTLSGLSGMAGKLGGLGNALGGIGKLAGSIGKVAGFLGPAGMVASFAAPLIGMFAGLFTRAAKRIGEEVAKNINGIMDRYNSKQATLADTIKELEKERASAIARLSGKKGGQDQLAKLLPEIDKSLKSLKAQQDDIKKKFETNVAILKSGDEITQKWVRDWVDINAQVKEYLDAVGRTPATLANANDFLNAMMSQKRKELSKELREAEKEAIQNALRLNELMEERNKAEDEFKKTKFELLTADSVERRGAGAIQRGRELAQKKKEHEENLKRLDQEIETASYRVGMEREIFKLAQDTSALRARDTEIQKQLIGEELALVKARQQLLAQTSGMISTDGRFSGKEVFPGTGNIPGLMNELAKKMTPQLTVYINGRQQKPGVKNGEWDVEFDYSARRGMTA